MSIEIKELIIRAIVIEGEEDDDDNDNTGVEGEDRDTIIKACVEQVLRILKKTKER